MAASYQTGSSTSPSDLLQKLVTWLVAQGWTSNASASEGTGWRAHLEKGTIFMNFRAAGNENIWPRVPPPTSYYHDYDVGGYGIGLYMGTGYAGASVWDMETGRPIRAGDTDLRGLGCGMNLPASGGDYHFFDDGNDNVIVVVERSPGIFCHMGWGPAMFPAGQPEDFPYFFASSSAYMNTVKTYPADRYGLNLSALPPFSHADKDYDSYGGGSRYIHSNAFVRVDAATFVDRWIGNGCRNTKGYGYTGRFMRNALNCHPGTQGEANEHQYLCYRWLLHRTHQSAFAGGLLLPFHSYVLTEPNARWAPIGFPPTVFWSEAVGEGFSQNEIYQVGGIDYMLFPHFAVRKDA
jgi:hypothetical protein